VTSDWTIGPNRFPTSGAESLFEYPGLRLSGGLHRRDIGEERVRVARDELDAVRARQELHVRERVRLALRVDFNNLPFPQPQFAAPNAVYNTNAPLVFGRFTSVRGGTSVRRNVDAAYLWSAAGCSFKR